MEKSINTSNQANGGSAQKTIPTKPYFKKSKTKQGSKLSLQNANLRTEAQGPKILRESLNKSQITKMKNDEKQIGMLSPQNTKSYMKITKK